MVRRGVTRAHVGGRAGGGVKCVVPQWVRYLTVVDCTVPQWNSERCWQEMRGHRWRRAGVCPGGMVGRSAFPPVMSCLVVGFYALAPQRFSRDGRIVSRCAPTVFVIGAGCCISPGGTSPGASESGLKVVLPLGISKRPLWHKGFQIAFRLVRPPPANLGNFFVRVEIAKVVVPQQVFAKGANFSQVKCDRSD